MRKLFRGDYFYFSKSDRIAAFILLLIIIVSNVLRVKLDRPVSPEIVADVDTLFVAKPKADTVKIKKEPPVYNNYRKNNSKRNSSSKTVAVKKETPVDTLTERPVFVQYKRKEIPTQAIDLNVADTTALVLLPGIGSYYAKRIVEYRDLLGGYVGVEQLKEINGIQDSVLRWFVITDTVPIRKVNINKLSLSKLRNHPYISFYQAKAITDYRRSEGDIKSPAQLSFMEEFTEQDLIRLEPYISFE